MAKLIFFIMLSVSSATCEVSSYSVYENNCVSCHKKLPVSIDKYFYRYLLKYSSKKDVTEAMYEYLKHPLQKNSIMSDAFIRRFGVKKPTSLSDQELKEALDEYWRLYTIRGKLK